MPRGGPAPALLAALMVAATAARSAPPTSPLPESAFTHPAWRVPLPDGRRLNLRCLGAGAPTVLLESGFAGTSKAWRSVMPLVAPQHRVCAYDRAGYGFSSAGPLPRDGAATARDLRAALKAARLRGPFVLVGHSAGALYVRLFAAAARENVAGLVLVDPSIEHQDRRFAIRFNEPRDDMGERRRHILACLAAAEDGGATPAATDCSPGPADSARPHGPRKGAVSPADRWRTELSELDSLWAATSDEVEARPADLADTPLIVLTADASFAAAPSPRREALQAFWVSMHRELAARSRHGQQRTVAGSSHMMMTDRPDAIAAAIEEVSRGGRQ